MIQNQNDSQCIPETLYVDSPFVKDKNFHNNADQN